MGRRKRNLPLLESVEFTDIGEGGKAVGRHQEKVVFAKGAVPGDVGNVQVYRKKSSFFEGQLTELVKSSEDRTAPFCNHFELCGGCSWQHLNYNAQASFKEAKVKAALERIGKIEVKEWQPILKALETTHHRNKLEFTFSENKWLTDEQIKSDAEFDRNGLGFHLPGKFDKILHVEQCYLQDDRTNLIRNFVFEKSKSLGISYFNLRAQVGVLRNLIVRNTRINKWMVILVITEFNDLVNELLQEISNQFEFVSSVFYVVNQKKNDSIADLNPIHFKGQNHIQEVFETPENEKVKYRIGPKSFFQTNSNQAEKLYQLAYNLIAPQPHETMYDFYTGTGSIALFFAKAIQKVVGVEYVEEAVADARINAQENGLENTTFLAGDMKDIFTDEFITKHGTPDFVVTDPPRAGMHEDVVKRLVALKAKRVLYISCNPSTQARDLSLMKDSYTVEFSQPVDMFPHTNHVENVVLLKLK